MRQQHLITPQQSSLDRPTYRFKLPFLAILSFDAAFFTSTVFVAEIINPTLSTTPINSLPILITFGLFLIISGSFLATYLTLKLIGDLTICPAGINGKSSLGYSMYIDWQDVSSIKVRYLFGIRYLSICSIVNKKRSIVIDSFAYNIPKILDRIREYVGDDHPLTIALEKEVLLPRQNPARTLWQIIIGIIVIFSIWLIGGNLYADYREKPLNQAITNYVRQHPKMAPNQAAVDLQASMAKLGISIVGFGDGSKEAVKPDKLAAQEWKAITPILDEYVNKQLGKTEDLILPPVKLHAYLNSHQADIIAIQTQLLGNTMPNWGSDSAWVERSDFKAGDSLYTEQLYYADILRFSRLLIANIYDQQPPPNWEASQELKAIENLSRSFQKQPTLFERLVARISERDLNKIYRHINFTTANWQENLLDSSSSEMMQTGIEHELLSQVRMIQDPKILMMDLAVTENRHRFPFIYLLKYHHMARPYTRLMAINYYQKSRENLSFWMTQNICQISKGAYARDLDNFIDIQEVPRQYFKVKTSDLERELTTSVRQIKSQLQSGESIDKITGEFKLTSQACPGEQWTAKVKDGSVTISLSHPPNWKALGMDEKLNVDRFTYKINAKNIKPVRLS